MPLLSGSYRPDCPRWYDRPFISHILLNLLFEINLSYIWRFILPISNICQPVVLKLLFLLHLIIFHTFDWYILISLFIHVYSLLYLHLGILLVAKLGENEDLMRVSWKFRSIRIWLVRFFRFSSRGHRHILATFVCTTRLIFII